MHEVKCNFAAKKHFLKFIQVFLNIYSSFFFLKFFKFFLGLWLIIYAFSVKKISGNIKINVVHHYSLSLDLDDLSCLHKKVKLNLELKERTRVV